MKVGVLMGGISSEREVSLSSGKSVMEHINKEKYEVIPVVIDKKEDVFEKVKGLDFALLALHGKFGEDGEIQSILKALDIPYSGCDNLSSGICMNKDLTKAVLKANDVRTARWLNVRCVEEIDYDKIEEMKYPVFIKPTSGGSSVATFKVKKKEDVEAAVVEGLKWDTEVLIEEFVKGSEITCPVFNGELYPVLAIEAKSEFYDYKDKYSANGADHFPITLEENLYKEVEKMALGAYKALKCSVYARIDMIITEEGVPYVLEANTLPGMTSTSLFPQSAAEKGINFTQFLDNIIETSMKNFI